MTASVMLDYRMIRLLHVPLHIQSHALTPDRRQMEWARRAVGITPPKP